MSTEFSRRDALRLLGLSAGASILPVSCICKKRTGPTDTAAGNTMTIKSWINP
jgi:hypothetical protein